MSGTGWDVFGSASNRAIDSPSCPVRWLGSAHLRSRTQRAKLLLQCRQLPRISFAAQGSADAASFDFPPVRGPHFKTFLRRAPLRLCRTLVKWQRTTINRGSRGPSSGIARIARPRFRQVEIKQSRVSPERSMARSNKNERRSPTGQVTAHIARHSYCTSWIQGTAPRNTPWSSPVRSARQSETFERPSCFRPQGRRQAHIRTSGAA